MSIEVRSIYACKYRMTRRIRIYKSLNHFCLNESILNLFFFSVFWSNEFQREIPVIHNLRLSIYHVTIYLFIFRFWL